LYHQIRQLVENAPIPDDLNNAILAAYRQMDGSNAFVAVRSSATAEDLPEASFAGQQETYLGVRGEDALIDSVRKCWASLWTERAIAYRQRNGFEHAQVYLAVVVQAMVQSQTAGVLFTVNPMTGDADEMLVNAAYGLGESVVSGQITPDAFILSRTQAPHILSNTAGTKETRLDMLPGGGIHKHAVPFADRQRLSLNPDQLARLLKLGEKVETHYQKPQDIEWAFVDDSLYLLQTRPITSLDKLITPHQHRMRKLSKAEYRVLDDILEHYPDPPLPLDYRAVADGYEQLLIPMRDFGLSIPPADSIIRMDDQGIPYIEPIALHLTWDIFKMPALLRKLLRRQPDRWMTEQAPLFAARLEALKGKDMAELDNDALARHISAAMQLAHEIALIRFSQAIIPMILRGIALKTLIRLVNGGRLVVEADLLGDLPYKTALIDEALWQLASVADATPAVRQAVLNRPMNEIIPTLEQNEAGRQYLGRVNTFLDEHGARTMKMYLPFANRSWCEDPASLMATLAVMLRSGAIEKHRRREEHFGAWRDETAGKLPGFLRKRFLKTLENYRSGHIAREATLYAIEEAYGVARQGAQEAATRLVDMGALSASDDVLYLTLPELYETLRRQFQIEDMRELVAVRRKARPAARATWQDRGQNENHVVTDVRGKETLTGQPGSPGVASGPVRVITRPAEFDKLQLGDVLVCPFTDPAWTPLFSLAAAVVADTGGSLSHAAIVAREYGIPAVLGTQIATSTLHDGVQVTVDGGRGVVVLA
jgi:pyruvate,water dikinase